MSWNNYDCNIPSPCYKCPDRTPTCHGKDQCEKYTEFINKRKVEKLAIEKAKSIKATHRNYAVEFNTRIKRRHK